MASAYRIKRAHRQAVLCRQRRIAVAVLIFALFAAWFFNIFLFNPTSIEAADDSFIYVPVRSGDTLWSIATEYKPADKDLRDFVRLVAAVNDTENFMIRAGQTLRIPQ